MPPWHDYGIGSRAFQLESGHPHLAIGEVFNIFNIANLSGYSGDLSSATFGQPTSRASNVFGSGGPCAFQFALRLSF